MSEYCIGGISCGSFGVALQRAVRLGSKGSTWVVSGRRCEGKVNANVNITSHKERTR